VESEVRNLPLPQVTISPATCSAPQTDPSPAVAAAAVVDTAAAAGPPPPGAVGQQLAAASGLRVGRSQSLTPSSGQRRESSTSLAPESSSWFKARSQSLTLNPVSQRGDFDDDPSYVQHQLSLGPSESGYVRGMSVRTPMYVRTYVWICEWIKARPRTALVVA